MMYWNDSTDINRSWENTKENIKTSATDSLGLCKLKRHKPLFDEECSLFLDQSKQANCSSYTIQTKPMQIM